MPFNRLDLLPNYDRNEASKSRKRWNENEDLRDKILALVRKGGGEDFLQWDFENGNLGFMEDQWDLAGITLFNEEIEFPEGDNFENIDFAHSEFWHCKFYGATFPQTHFPFARFYNVEFKNCLFGFAHFYGAKLEKCRFVSCDFVEENGFSNCELIDTKFIDCFFNKRKFTDCRFDENVSFSWRRDGRVPRNTNSDFKETLEDTAVSGIYRCIKDGYLSGEVYHLVRKYLFLQQQAFTRYNRVGFDRARALCWEIIAGYGVKPIRVKSLSTATPFRFQ
jgi:hypothetical protein